MPRPRRLPTGSAPAPRTTEPGDCVMSELILCAACARHVRLHEPQCPFCRASLTPAPPRPKALAIPVGLSRSRLRALHAAALATGVAAAACGAGESSTGPLGSSDAAERDGEGRDVASGDDATSGSDATSAADAASGDVAASDVVVTDARTI